MQSDNNTENLCMSCLRYYRTAFTDSTKKRLDDVRWCDHFRIVVNEAGG